MKKLGIITIFYITTLCTAEAGSILNNFNVNLQPIPIGSFNPVINSKYSDMASDQNQQLIQQAKIRGIMEKAQNENRPLTPYEVGMISEYNPNIANAYNNAFYSQSR